MQLFTAPTPQWLLCMLARLVDFALIKSVRQKKENCLLRAAGTAHLMLELRYLVFQFSDVLAGVRVV